MDNVSREKDSESSDSNNSESTPVGSFSRRGSWRHEGYSLLETLGAAPEVNESMDLTRNLSDILDRLLNIESGILNRILMLRMHPPPVEADVLYGNVRQEVTGSDSESDHTASYPPPPPIPERRQNLTLPLPKRNPFGGSPRTQGTDGSRGFQGADVTPKHDVTPGKSGSQRYPRTGNTRHIQETGETFIYNESSDYVKELLRGKKKKTKVVNGYIVALFILSNVMILGFSVLGTILVINNVYPCECTQMPQMPAPRPAYTSMISTSDVPQQDDPTLHKLHEHVADSNPTLGHGIGAAEGQEGDYRITIAIRNGTTEDDFWAN